MSDPDHSPYLGPIRSVFGCGSKFCFPEPQEPPGPRLAGRRGWNPNAAAPSCADIISVLCVSGNQRKALCRLYRVAADTRIEDSAENVCYNELIYGYSY